MSWSFPDFGTMVSWVFHVPDTYELLWWVLICICWFGMVNEYRLKKLQKQLDDITAKDAGPRETSR